MWHTIRTPELAEPLSGPTRIKFLLGDIAEELILMLAKEAGHLVENEQTEVYVKDVRGRTDSTIDGELVDVKSASPFSFTKFATHGLGTDDGFGYLDQLGAYGSRIGIGDRNHFLAVEKVKGKLHLDSWPKSRVNFEKLVEERQAMLAKDEPPPRGYSDEKFGESGNRKLGVECSYCAFKKHCWPGLRVFGYKSRDTVRPVFLTKVVREPDVPELKDYESE